jgi:hypothetical protein
MAGRAQTLDCPESESIPIATVRCDVISDASNADDASIITELAQWELLELQAASPAPHFELVPFTPWPLLWSNCHRHCFT